MVGRFHFVQPVSYTHLDVYKRQVYKQAIAFPFLKEETHHISKYCYDNLGTFSKRLECRSVCSSTVSRPVSYTHLDVYKRQMYRPITKNVLVTYVQYKGLKRTFLVKRLIATRLKCHITSLLFTSELFNTGFETSVLTHMDNGPVYSIMLEDQGFYCQFIVKPGLVFSFVRFSPLSIFSELSNLMDFYP